jgi:hypothetical protein
MVVHVVQWPIFASPERSGSVSSCSVRRGEGEDLQLVLTGRDASSSIMKDDESITCREEGEKKRRKEEKIQREKWEEVTGPCEQTVQTMQTSNVDFPSTSTPAVSQLLSARFRMQSHV